MARPSFAESHGQAYASLDHHVDTDLNNLDCSRSGHKHSDHWRRCCPMKLPDVVNWRLCAISQRALLARIQCQANERVRRKCDPSPHSPVNSDHQRQLPFLAGLACSEPHRPSRGSHSSIIRHRETIRCSLRGCIHVRCGSTEGLSCLRGHHERLAQAGSRI